MCPIEHFNVSGVFLSIYLGWNIGPIPNLFFFPNFDEKNPNYFGEKLLKFDSLSLLILLNMYCMHPPCKIASKNIKICRNYLFKSMKINKDQTER